MFLVIEHFFRGRVPNTRHAAFFFGSGVSGKVARYWQERRRRRFGDIRRSVIRIVGEVGRSRKKKIYPNPALDWRKSGRRENIGRGRID